MGKLLKNSRLSNYQIRKIIEYFALELTSVQTAKQLKINRKTIDRVFQIIRKKSLISKKLIKIFFPVKSRATKAILAGYTSIIAAGQLSLKYLFLAY